MEWREEARASFRAIVWSPWGLLLAVALVAGPAMLALGMLRGGAEFGEDPVDATISVLASIAGFPSLFVALALVIMLAAGAFAPGPRAAPTLAGRLGALLSLAAVAWALPTALLLLSRIGSASLAPILLAFGIAALEIVALATLFSLFAELGPTRAPLLGAGLLLLAFQLVPVATYALLPFFVDSPSADAFALWQTGLGFLTPMGAADQLQGAVFPRTLFMLDEMTRTDHPVLFSPWLWLGALAAWIAVPMGILLRATPATPPDEDEPQSA